MLRDFWWDFVEKNIEGGFSTLVKRLNDQKGVNFSVFERQKRKKSLELKYKILTIFKKVGDALFKTF